MNRSKLAIGIFIALVLIVLTIVLLACTVFIIRHITVESDVTSSLIDSDRIVESSGLTKGKSIISINKTKVRANIEKENPYVKVVSVVRKFPNKVIINTTLRTGILLVPSNDGDSYAVMDSSAKILTVLASTEREKYEGTMVENLSFLLPEEGTAAAIGTSATFNDATGGELLQTIAEGAEDPSIEISGASFFTFFKKIVFDFQDGAKAYILTNKGVTLVVDTSLSISVREQIYMCVYFFASEDVDVDLTQGYIVYDKTENAYQWSESLE